MSVLGSIVRPSPSPSLLPHVLLIRLHIREREPACPLVRPGSSTPVPTGGEHGRPHPQHGQPPRAQQTQHEGSLARLQISRVRIHRGEGVERHRDRHGRDGVGIRIVASGTGGKCGGQRDRAGQDDGQDSDGDECEAEGAREVLFDRWTSVSRCMSAPEADVPVGLRDSVTSIVTMSLGEAISGNA